MANFATHIGVGTVVSGVMATMTLAADILSADSLLAVTLAGVVGSVIPDIDLKDSRASRAIFSGFAFFFAFCVMFLNAGAYSIVELWILVGIVFLGVRYGAEAAFHRFSYHRGIWHSILAAFLFAALTAICFHQILGKHPGVAWLAGGFMFVGTITHLILDEVYSVDLMDRRLKLSFGSALKLIDRRKFGETVAVAGMTVIAFLLAPPTKDFFEGVTSPQIWSGIHERLLPRDNTWFGMFGPDGARAFVRDEDVSQISTGSVRKEPQE
ncbi:MAG: metal-dependent hydrolase [Pseudomonadota bacterium]